MEKESTEKCYLEYDDAPGNLTCSYNHRDGEEFVMDEPEQSTTPHTIPDLKKQVRGRFGNIWYLMNYRMRPNHKSHKVYFDRGIKVEWSSYEEFKNNMYESYLKHVEEFGERQTSIDRINGEGNYCKQNCRWATPREQILNRKNMPILEINGVTKTALEWAEINGIARTTATNRVRKLHWNLLDSVTIPANGRPITLDKWKEIAAAGVAARIKKYGHA